MTSEEQVSLGKRIRTLREEAGMTLRDLEKASGGVTAGYLSQLERGEAQNPSVDTVQKIAHGLKTPVSEILGESSEPASRVGRIPGGLRTFMAQANELGKPLKDEDVKMLMGIRYRGKQPRTAEDWALLYSFIKKIVG